MYVSEKGSRGGNEPRTIQVNTTNWLVAAPPPTRAHLQFFDFCPWAHTCAIFQVWPPQG